MVSERAKVVLNLSDEQIESLSRNMARAQAAAKELHRDWTLSDATWEPHDWSEF